VLDLRFMAANADIQSGDMLVTSGIDGVYPAGLAVARVTRVETKSSDAFAHIVCTPIAGVDRHKQLLILLVDGNLPLRPPPDAAPVKGSKGVKISQEVRDRLVEKAPAAGAAAPVAAAVDAAAAAPDAKPPSAPAGVEAKPAQKIAPTPASTPNTTPTATPTSKPSSTPAATATTQPQPPKAAR
jgi:rod shape-determining protein MreC